LETFFVVTIGGIAMCTEVRNDAKHPTMHKTTPDKELSNTKELHSKVPTDVLCLRLQEGKRRKSLG
jgi:hypothetical protein